MNLQSLSYLRYPETPVSLHSPQGETGVRSPRGYDVAVVEGGEFALRLVPHQRAAPSTGGQVHTHKYSLCSFIDARRTKMGIKYVLPSPHTSSFATAAIGKVWDWVLAQHNSTHNYIHQPPATKEAGLDQAPIVFFYAHHHRHDPLLQIYCPWYYCSVQSWECY
jgi:hypothetical protein